MGLEGRDLRLEGGVGVEGGRAGLGGGGCDGWEDGDERGRGGTEGRGGSAERDQGGVEEAACSDAEADREEVEPTSLCVQILGALRADSLGQQGNETASQEGSNLPQIQFRWRESWEEGGGGVGWERVWS